MNMDNDPLLLKPSARKLDERQCRFCFETPSRFYNRLIQPCKCRGSLSYIHVLCLAKWFQIRPSAPMCERVCELCHSPFRVRLFEWKLVPFFLVCTTRNILTFLAIILFSVISLGLLLLIIGLFFMGNIPLGFAALFLFQWPIFKFSLMSRDYWIMLLDFTRSAFSPPVEWVTVVQDFALEGGIQSQAERPPPGNDIFQLGGDNDSSSSSSSSSSSDSSDSDTNSSVPSYLNKYGKYPFRSTTPFENPNMEMPGRSGVNQTADAMLDNQIKTQYHPPSPIQTSALLLPATTDLDH